MASKRIRAAVVGASSLLGKELANVLNTADDALWDLTLLDAEAGVAAEPGGQLQSVGEEALLVQSIVPGSFDGMDVVFFAADKVVAKQHVKEAVGAGAAVVDLTGALEAEGIAVCAPVLMACEKQKIVVSAHPSAVLLGMVAQALGTKATGFLATVLEPASQAGNEGVDEVHKQTVALLSFQQVPKDVYGQQVAFNLSSSSADDAKVSLRDVATRVKAHLAKLVPSAAVSIQMVQAPVFHGYAASIFVETPVAMDFAAIEEAFSGRDVEVVGEDEDASTLSAIENGSTLVRVGDISERGFWLWVACDNLKLAAQNAAACAKVIVS